MEVSDTDVRDPALLLCAVVRRCAHLGSKRVQIGVVEVQHVSVQTFLPHGRGVDGPPVGLVRGRWLRVGLDCPRRGVLGAMLTCVWPTRLAARERLYVVRSPLICSTPVDASPVITFSRESGVNEEGGSPASSVSKAGLNALTRLPDGNWPGMASWSTRSARAGPPARPIPRAGPSFRPPPASSGRSRSRTAAPPAPSPATASPSPGRTISPSLVRVRPSPAGR